VLDGCRELLTTDVAAGRQAGRQAASVSSAYSVRKSQSEQLPKISSVSSVTNAATVAAVIAQDSPVVLTQLLAGALHTVCLQDS
jgi:hypothetical protein